MKKEIEELESNEMDIGDIATREKHHRFKMGVQDQVQAKCGD